MPRLCQGGQPLLDHTHGSCIVRAGQRSYPALWATCLTRTHTLSLSLSLSLSRSWHSTPGPDLGQAHSQVNASSFLFRPLPCLACLWVVLAKRTAMPAWERLSAYVSCTKVPILHACSTARACCLDVLKQGTTLLLVFAMPMLLTFYGHTSTCASTKPQAAGMCMALCM